MRNLLFILTFALLASGCTKTQQITAPTAYPAQAQVVKQPVYIEYSGFKTLETAHSKLSVLKRNNVIAAHGPYVKIDKSLTDAQLIYIKIPGFRTILDARRFIQYFRWDGFAYAQREY